MKTKTFFSTMLLVIIIIFSLQGCADDHSAQAEDSLYYVEKTSKTSFNDWPVNVTLEIYLTETRNNLGEIIKIIKIEINGTDNIFGIPIEDLQPCLTEISGGFYAGPHFTMDDGSIWSISRNSNSYFNLFRKTNNGWESLIPLDWLCKDLSGSGRRFNISLANQERTLSINIPADADYLIAGDGFEKYIPAIHGPSIELLKCNSNYH